MILLFKDVTSAYTEILYINEKDKKIYYKFKSKSSREYTKEEVCEFKFGLEDYIPGNVTHLINIHNNIFSYVEYLIFN